MLATLLHTVSIVLIIILSTVTAAEAARLPRANKCGASTFADRTTHASPLVKDCQVLAGNIRGSGTWSVTYSHRTLATYGTCAFGAEAHYTGIATVGNEDIRDLIADSIRMFASEDGKIGAMGEMDCQSTDERTVGWGIYHT